jgi:hypothetical protein
VAVLTPEKQQVRIRALPKRGGPLGKLLSLSTAPLPNVFQYVQTTIFLQKNLPCRKDMMSRPIASLTKEAVT